MSDKNLSGKFKFGAILAAFKQAVADQKCRDKWIIDEDWIKVIQGSTGTIFAELGTATKCFVCTMRLDVVI